MNHETLQRYARYWSDCFLPTEQLKELRLSSIVLGALAEACVHRFATEIAAPLCVSTGAVLCSDGDRVIVNHADIIVHSRSPLPPLFERSGFALVPRESCYGVIEVKRSVHGCRNLETVRDRLDLASRWVCEERARHAVNSARKYVNRTSLAVFCVRDESKNGFAQSQAMVDDMCAVVLVDKSGNNVHPNVTGVVGLIEFLVGCRRLSKALDGLNTPTGLVPR